MSLSVNLVPYYCAQEIASQVIKFGMAMRTQSDYDNHYRGINFS